MLVQAQQYAVFSADKSYIKNNVWASRIHLPRVLHNSGTMTAWLGLLLRLQHHEGVQLLSRLQSDASVSIKHITTRYYYTESGSKKPSQFSRAESMPFSTWPSWQLCPPGFKMLLQEVHQKSNEMWTATNHPRSCAYCQHFVLSTLWKRLRRAKPCFKRCQNVCETAAKESQDL